MCRKKQGMVRQAGQHLVVSQKEVSGKAGKPSFAFFPSDVYCFSAQIAALFARNHPAQRPLVLPLRLELPRFGGYDAGARSGGGPLKDQSLGLEVCLRTGQTHSTSPEADKRFLES
jgi:hypothetical protein